MSTWHSQHQPHRVYEDEFDWLKGRQRGDYQILIKNKFMNGIGTISWINIKSALVSGVITAIIAGAGYVISVGDVFAIDVRSLTNVLALALLTSIVSIVKTLLTSNEGNFVGSVRVTE